MARSERIRLPVASIDAHTKRATLDRRLDVGDCHQSDAYIEFRDNGTGLFVAHTWTDAAARWHDDYWNQWCQVFLSDPGHNHLWLSWRGPGMAANRPRQRWEADFPLDPNAFQYLDEHSFVDWWAEC